LRVEELIGPLEVSAVRVLITYDVATATKDGERRLRRVARACEDFGQRVQKSVFECLLGPTEWAKLRQRLFEVADLASDSLRFYFLEADTRIEHHGAAAPTDLEGPLIV
jgi:CRISPR-associated protein Cas2